MGYLRVTNWHKYQHYRNRKPVWIKLYVDVLYDDKLRQLPVATRLLWDQLMLLAAERANVIPNDPELVAKLVGIPPRDCREGINQLLKGRWLSQTSGTRRASKPASKVASPEKELEKEKETPLPPLGKTGKANGSVDVNLAVTAFLHSPAWDESFDQQAIREEFHRIARKPRHEGQLDELGAVRLWQELRAKRYEEAV